MIAAGRGGVRLVARSSSTSRPAQLATDAADRATTAAVVHVGAVAAFTTRFALSAIVDFAADVVGTMG